MDFWGAPMDWWTVVVAANQGASLKHYPPYSWPGGSQAVAYATVDKVVERKALVRELLRSVQSLLGKILRTGT